MVAETSMRPMRSAKTLAGLETVMALYLYRFRWNGKAGNL
jgi:hypothetical protein